MPTDDAGLEFRRQEQDIIMDLGVENIYDICPSKFAFINFIPVHCQMIFIASSEIFFTFRIHILRKMSNIQILYQTGWKIKICL